MKSIGLSLFAQICADPRVLKWEKVRAQHSFCRKNIFVQLRELVSLKDSTMDLTRHHNTGRNDDLSKTEFNRMQLRNEIAGNCLMFLTSYNESSC